MIKFLSISKLPSGLMLNNSIVTVLIWAVAAVSFLFHITPIVVVIDPPK